MSEPFLGELKLIGFGFTPKSWLPCDGRLMSIALNNTLFSLLGTSYGGDGVTTFALPDLRGRIAIGPTTGINVGARGGEESHTLTVAELPAHSHAANCSSMNGNRRGVAGAVWASDSARLNPPYRSDAANGAMHAQSSTMTGGGQAHDNMQPFTALTWIICVSGIFPPRPPA
jgi:microcystin-dependent protein